MRTNCNTESSHGQHHALNEGERLWRTAEGVAVIHVTADDETGGVSALDVLARHGLIPGGVRGADPRVMSLTLSRQPLNFPHDDPDLRWSVYCEVWRIGVILQHQGRSDEPRTGAGQCTFMPVVIRTA